MKNDTKNLLFSSFFVLSDVISKGIFIGLSSEIWLRHASAKLNVLRSRGSEEHYEQLSIKADRIILFIFRYTTIIFLTIFYQSLNNQSTEDEWTEIGRKSVFNSAILQ